MQCLLLRLKFRSAQEASHHADFMGNCPTVSQRVCFIYLADEMSLCSWCSWMKWARWVNLKFSLSLSGFHQVEWGREMSPRFPFTTSGVWELSLRSRNLVCVVCFCSIGDWSLKLLWEMRVGFENTCTATGKWNVSRVIPRLYGWVCKIWRLFPLADEKSVAIMTASSQSRRSQIVSSGRLWLRVPN